MTLNESDISNFSIHDDESKNMDPNKNLSHQIYQGCDESGKSQRTISIDKISNLVEEFNEFNDIANESGCSDLENIFQTQENNGKSIFNILFLY